MLYVASMIAGSSKHGFAQLAFQLFREMLFEETMPDQMTQSAFLKSLSCSSFSDIICGFPYEFQATFHCIFFFFIFLLVSASNRVHCSENSLYTKNKG